MGALIKRNLAGYFTNGGSVGGGGVSPSTRATQANKDAIDQYEFRRILRPIQHFRARSTAIIQKR